jgi:hypothetical protein
MTREQPALRVPQYPGFVTGGQSAFKMIIQDNQETRNYSRTVINAQIEQLSDGWKCSHELSTSAYQKSLKGKQKVENNPEVTKPVTTLVWKVPADIRRRIFKIME